MARRPGPGWAETPILVPLFDMRCPPCPCFSQAVPAQCERANPQREVETPDRGPEQEIAQHSQGQGGHEDQAHVSAKHTKH